MRELWGSITTEEQTEICRRAAVQGYCILYFNIFCQLICISGDGVLDVKVTSVSHILAAFCLVPQSCTSSTLLRHKSKIDSTYATLILTFIIKHPLKVGKVGRVNVPGSLIGEITAGGTCPWVRIGRGLVLEDRHGLPETYHRRHQFE